MNMNLKKKLNLNSYEWWRNHRRFVTLGIFLVLFGSYLRSPAAKDFKINDTCGRLSSDLITGEKAAKILKLGNKRIEGIKGVKTKITNYYYHAKYYCQGYKKGNVGLGY